MSAFKNLLLAECGSLLSAGSYVLAVSAAILMSPAISPRQNVQAAIDETMPAAIPDSIVADWKDQDRVGTSYYGAINSIVEALPAQYAEKYTAGATGLSEEKRYLLACHFRRVCRIKKHEADIGSIMFARHHNFGGIVVGYHDNSDPQNTDWPSGGGKGALCLLNMENYYSEFKEILTRSDAVVRDPCISFDGKKVLFAISGKGKGTGYKIYEMEIANPTTLTQLTKDDSLGAVVADFEPCYLPSGDILFTSTRNFGMSAHGFIPTTNMFLMNAEGKFMRQIGFDQANTFYPVLMDDGMVLYTRWEYNDRDLTNSMGLFFMSPDGAHQTEWFGNQTGWPFTMIHGRPIPGTNNSKVICIAGGHHGPYAGELMIIDRNKGTNGNQPIQMIAPQRETKPDVQKSDMATGNVYFIAQTPYPLDENDFLVSWRKTEGSPYSGLFKLYLMDVEGKRELLAWADQSLSQPVPVKARDKKPPKITGRANYTDSMGSVTMLNVYIGEGMKGIARGAAKSLRVVKLHYRVAGGTIGQTMGSGPSGAFASAITCPVSAYGASWEAKEVLGEAKIYADGSAAFNVPARTPVYFQVLDSMGHCIATMRSWSTLMPGELHSCVGCHESKLEPPPPGGATQAGVPRKLDTPLGIENKPFDYKQMVQPIFDKNCVICHGPGHASGFDLSGDLSVSSASKKWTTSYNSLLKGISRAASNDAVNICTIFSPPEQQPPRSFGSSLSGIMTKGGMSGSHHEVQVTETERKIVACWIDLCAPHAGKYNSYMSASDSTKYEKLLEKRAKWSAVERENIMAYLAAVPVMPDDRGVKSTHTAVQKMGVRYLPKQHALVVQKPFQGNLTVLDLRGRVMCRMNLSDGLSSGKATISLPVSLNPGIYIAGFEGVNGVRPEKISIAE